MKGNTVFVTLASTDTVILKVHKITKEGKAKLSILIEMMLWSLSLSNFYD